jgi:hypothetical protein
LLRFARNDANNNAPFSTHHRHTPRRRSIQYAASSRFNHGLLEILDHPPSRMKTTEHSFATPRQHSPEFCKFVCPQKKEGAGKTGCALHPRSHVPSCTSKKRTRAYRFSGSSPAFPAQCRTLKRCSSIASSRPPLPAPTSVTMANVPSSRDRMAKNKQVIWVKSQGQFLKIRNTVEV